MTSIHPRARAIAAVLLSVSFSLIVPSSGVHAQEDPGLPTTGLPPAPRRAASTRGLASTIETGFDVKKDGLPFGNPGDFGSLIGNCLGMSLIAIDNHERRKTAEASGHATSFASDSSRTLETVGLAQQNANLDYLSRSRWWEDPVEHELVEQLPLSDPSAIRGALDRMARTKRPEVMTMRSIFGGHAVVLHGYKDGKLQIYDPNFPGETVAWPWDPHQGLGTHPKAAPTNAANYYSALEKAGAAPPSTFMEAKDLERIREACANDLAVCTGRYPTVTANAVKGTRGVIVSGTISRGPGLAYDLERTPTVDRAWIKVDGKFAGFTRVGLDGGYSLLLDEKLLAGGKYKLEVVAVADGSFAGFTELLVSASGSTISTATPPPPVTKGITRALADSVK